MDEVIEQMDWTDGKVVKLLKQFIIENDLNDECIEFLEYHSSMEETEDDDRYQDFED